MRWFPFLIFAYLFVAMQFALGGVLQWGQWTPNLVLLLVIFIGLHAPLETALFAGLFLGLMHDVVTSYGIGTYALAYTLIAGLALQLRGAMYSDHFVTHFAITLILGTLLTAYLIFRQWVRSFYFTETLGIEFWPHLSGVLVSALLAIPMIWLLRRSRRTFSFNNK